MRKAIEVDHTGNQTKIMAMKVVVNDATGDKRPHGENCHPRCVHRDAAVGGTHIVQTYLQTRQGCASRSGSRAKEPSDNDNEEERHAVDRLPCGDHTVDIVAFGVVDGANFACITLALPDAKAAHRPPAAPPKKVVEKERRAWANNEAIPRLLTCHSLQLLQSGAIVASGCGGTPSKRLVERRSPRSVRLWSKAVQRQNGGAINRPKKPAVRDVPDYGKATSKALHHRHIGPPDGVDECSHEGEIHASNERASKSSSKREHGVVDLTEAACDIPCLLHSRCAPLWERLASSKAALDGGD